MNKKMLLLSILNNPIKSQNQYVVRYDRGDEFGYYCESIYYSEGEFEVLENVNKFKIFDYEEVKELDFEYLNELLRRECDCEDLEVNFEYISLYNLVLEYLIETL